MLSTPAAASCPTLRSLPACACVHDQDRSVNTLISPLDYVYSSMSYPCFSDLVDEIFLHSPPDLCVSFPCTFSHRGLGVRDCLDDEKIIRVFYYTSRNDTHLSHTEAQEIEPFPHCFPSPCNAIMAIPFSHPCLCSWAPNYHPTVFVSHVTSYNVVTFKVNRTPLHFPQGRPLR